jgi:RNA polymerase sigma factor for flagellar operon FliA
MTTVQVHSKVNQAKPGDKNPSRVSGSKSKKPSASGDESEAGDVAARLALRAELDALPSREVWERYQANPTREVRNYFMEKFLHLVRYNAERIYTRLPDEVDIEDLMSAGLFGLMDAIDAFDLDRQVKFETFCAPRIRGAILDELRSMDWVPRLVRHRTRTIETARMKLEMRLGRTPSLEEISQFLGVDEEELKKILKDGSAVSITSLSRRAYNSDSSREVREIDVIQDGRQGNPLTEIQHRDLKELLTKGLTRAERLIVVLYYYEEMTMKEIGLTLDLSESRVSQMHSSILARLKAQMQHRSREFEPTN